MIIMHVTNKLFVVFFSPKEIFLDTYRLSISISAEN